MKAYLRIIRYLKGYPTQALMTLLFNLLAVAFSIASLAVVVPFLNILFDEKAYSPSDIPAIPEFTGLLAIDDFLLDTVNHYFIGSIVQQGRMNTLLYVCIAIVIVFFLKNLFRYLGLYFVAPIKSGVVRDLRRQLYHKTLELPLSYYAKNKKGDLLSRMTSDVQEVEISIISALELTFREPITILGYLGLMLYISPTLTGFVLVLLVVMGLMLGRIGKTLKRESVRTQTRLGQLIAMMEETLGGVKIIQAFSAEKNQRQRFDSVNDDHNRIYTGMSRRRSLASPLSEFLAMIVVAIVLWFGGWLVLTEANMSGSTFILFILTFALLIQPAKSFSSAIYNIQRGLASTDRINSILDAPDTIPEKEGGKSLEAFQKGITFNQVGFSYDDDDKLPVLQQIDLTIPKGHMVALVGPSGAGKSTLADLLPRFYDVKQGSISIDGTDIRDLKLGNLRGLLGIVTQEAVLFNDTVHNNIAFGIEGATRQQVVQAAKIANAHRFIEQMEQGYDTVIGDRGSQLSGGERQRLTIARAVLNDPPILILDEATSSLDTESEKLVQEALFQLMENRTSLVIAHRLSTIQHADTIVVMEKGRIVEQGRHDELLQKGGLYKKLVQMQDFE